MHSYRNIRKAVIGLLACVSLLAGSYGLTLYAQQRNQGLTPPPKPAGSPIPADADQTTASPDSGTSFVAGERLVYSVSLSGFPTAARIEMEVTERGQFFGQDCFQLRTKVESLGQVRSLFGELDNQYTSYAVPKTGLPHRLVMSSRQAQAQSEEVVLFDQPKKQAIFDDKTLDLSGPTYDITSLAYALRINPLAEGQKQRFTVLYGRELVEVEAIAGSKERIQTQAGSFSAIPVKLIPHKKFAKYRVKVWFSDDSRHLPVLATSTLPMGEARAELASVGVTVRTQPTLSQVDPKFDESGTNPIITRPTGNGGGTKPPSAPGNGTSPGPLPPEEIVEEKIYPFSVGERLNYDIAWGNFASVGKASFEVRRQGMIGQNRVFEFFGEATSTGTASRLINVNDQIRSFVRVDTLTPLSNDLRLREGRRLRQVSATYDWSAGKAILSSGSSTDLRNGTLDLISLFYVIRASDLKIGSVMTYPFLDANHRLQSLSARVNKQEAINSALGTKDALQLDILNPDAKLLLAQVWISNDSRRYPLYLVTRTKFGELRFQLTTASNSK